MDRTLSGTLARLDRDRLTEVAANAPRETFAAAAGLDFKLEKVQLECEGRPVSDVYGIRIIGESDPFGRCSVGSVYQLLQPSDLLDIGDAIIQRDPTAIRDTGGTLFGKRKAYLNLKLGGSLGVERNGRARSAFGSGVDTSIPYLLLSTTFDGSQRSVVCRSVVRTVCNNTLNFAIDSGTTVWVRHTGAQHTRIGEALDKLLAELDAGFATNYEELQALADTPLTRRDAAGFFAELMTGADNPEKAAEIIGKAKESSPRKFRTFEDTGAALLNLFEQGKGNFGQDAYDCLNAVTEFVDHHKQRIRKFRGKNEAMRLDAQLDYSQWGDGAAMKRTAHSKLLIRARR